MDLIGIPTQIVVGPRGLEKGMVETKSRATGAKEEMTLEAALNRFAH
jgi:prolyl-tRNA synthetase